MYLFAIQRNALLLYLTYLLLIALSTIKIQYLDFEIKNLI